MPVVHWNAPNKVETGVDKVVLYPKDGSKAVPWVGVLSVESQDAEPPASYYMEGRPVLYLPKPAEYTPTISAYTFPDELLSVLGLVETHGLELDSQPSDSFDLSFRTTVLMEDGSETHKLHLVYNAIASLQPLGYVSEGAGLSVVDFAFDIQAIPVQVPGYRATSHVVIDLADLDSEKRERVEDFLYGTGESDPVMPNPQTLYDILSGGDAIVVTLHDDGTWTARGSFDKIHMIAPGVFRIDDINAEHHGDGTYTISTGGNTIVKDEFE